MFLWTLIVSSPKEFLALMPIFVAIIWSHWSLYNSEQTEPAIQVVSSKSSIRPVSENIFLGRKQLLPFKVPHCFLKAMKISDLPQMNNRRKCSRNIYDKVQSIPFIFLINKTISKMLRMLKWLMEIGDENIGTEFSENNFTRQFLNFRNRSRGTGHNCPKPFAASPPSLCNASLFESLLLLRN